MALQTFEKVLRPAELQKTPKLLGGLISQPWRLYEFLTLSKKHFCFLLQDLCAKNHQDYLLTRTLYMQYLFKIKYIIFSIHSIKLLSSPLSIMIIHYQVHYQVQILYLQYLLFRGLAGLLPSQFQPGGAAPRNIEQIVKWIYNGLGEKYLPHPFSSYTLNL